MTTSTAKRRIAMILALAGLGGATADWISNMKVQASQQFVCQVRYHGGPKSDSTRSCVSSDKPA
jgi:hypothetical protein